jgi:O-antigen/teichoic acid export membrane protein
LHDPPSAAGVPMSGRRLLRGTAFTLTGQAATIAVSAFLTPFVVRQLLPASYGLLAFLNVLINYLAYSDIGMSVASTSFAARHECQGNPRRESEVIWTSAGLSVSFGLVVSAFVIVASPLICDRFLHLDTSLRQQGIPALRIIAGAFLLKNLAAVLNTPQLVRLRFDTYTAISSGGVMAQISLTPVVLWVGGDLVTVAIMIAVVNAAILVLHFVMGLKLLPQLWPPAVDRHLAKPLFKFGGTAVFSAITELVLTSAERVTLTYFTSVATLGFYSLGYTYATLATVVPVAMGQVLFPMFSRLQSAESRGELRALFRRSVMMMLVVLMPMAVLLAEVARPVLATWFGPLYARQSTPVAHILLIGVLFSAMTYAPVMLLFAAGKASTLARYRSCELILYLAVAPLLTMRYGILGAAAGWSLRVFGDCMALYLAVGKTECPGVLADILRSGSVVSILLPPLVLMWFHPAPWFWVPSVTLFCLLFYAFMVWRVVLTPSERAWLAAIPNAARAA